jgi:uncharacterized membrane protein YbhN (UPF0104 family)
VTGGAEVAGGADDRTADGAGAEPPVARHPAVARLIAVARVLVVLLVVAVVAYAVYRDWTAVSATLGQLSPGVLVLALVLASAGLGATVKTWQHLLAALGSPLRTPHASQVFLTGQLARYLPGSVWAFLLQAQLAHRHQIPRSRSLLAVLLAVGVTTVTGLTTAVVAVPVFADEWGPATWLLLGGPLTLVFLVPRLLTWVSNTALRVLRRPPLLLPIPGRPVAVAALWAVFSWLCYGAQLWLLATSTGGVPVTDLPLATATFALAVCAGFLAFVLPSGVGVREAVITVGLSSVMPAGAALALALVSRLVCTAADVLGALGAAVAVKVVDRGQGRSQPGR